MALNAKFLDKTKKSLNTLTPFLSNNSRQFPAHVGRLPPLPPLPPLTPSARLVQSVQSVESDELVQSDNESTASLSEISISDESDQDTSASHLHNDYDTTRTTDKDPDITDKTNDGIIPYAIMMNPNIEKESKQRIDPLKVGEMVASFINMALSLCMILTVICFILIIMICILNIIIFVVIQTAYFFNDDSDAILKDSLKYKILQYVDFFKYKENEKKDTNAATGTTGAAAPAVSISSAVSDAPAVSDEPAVSDAPAAPAGTDNTVSDTTQKPIKEPMFFIFTGINSCLSLIYLCYIFFIFVVCMSIILYILFRAIQFWHPTFPVDMNIPAGSLIGLTSFALYAGIVFAIIIGQGQALYFNNVIKPALTKIKQAIYNIDQFINKELTTPDSKFNAELFELLKSRSKGEIIDRYKAVVHNNIELNNVPKAIQQMKLILLYSYLHENIPETNQKALQLINYYFFKDPFSQQDNMDLRETGYLDDLTFVSLLQEAKMRTVEVTNIFDENFYKSDIVLEKNLVDQIKPNIAGFAIKISGLLKALPDFENNTKFIGFYSIGVGVVSLLLGIIFFIMVSKAKGIHSSIIGAANVTTTFLMDSIPPIATFAANLTDSEEAQKCNSCMSSTGKHICNMNVIKNNINVAV